MVSAKALTKYVSSSSSSISAFTLLISVIVIIVASFQESAEDLYSNPIKIISSEPSVMLAYSSADLSIISTTTSSVITVGGVGV